MTSLGLKDTCNVVLLWILPAMIIAMTAVATTFVITVTGILVILSTWILLSIIAITATVMTGWCKWFCAPDHTICSLCHFGKDCYCGESVFQYYFSRCNNCHCDDCDYLIYHFCSISSHTLNNHRGRKSNSMD